MSRQTITEPRFQMGDAEDALRLEGVRRSADWGEVKRRRRKRGHGLKPEWREASDSIRDATDQLRASGSRSGIPAGEARLLLENKRLLRTVIRESAESLETSRDLPHVEPEPGRLWPRAYVAGAAYLEAVKFRFDEASLLAFLDGVQTDHNLEMGEL